MPVPILRPRGNRFSRTLLAAMVLVPASLAVGARTPMAAAAHVTVRSSAVIAAIKRGAANLLAAQNSRTMWESGRWNRGKGLAQFNDYGGQTALVLEALLNVDQSLHLPELNIYSPKMRAAINFLCRQKPKGTYMASFQANAMALLPPKARYRRVLEEDAYYLLKSIHSEWCLLLHHAPDPD